MVVITLPNSFNMLLRGPRNLLVKLRSNPVPAYMTILSSVLMGDLKPFVRHPVWGFGG